MANAVKNTGSRGNPMDVGDWVKVIVAGVPQLGIITASDPVTNMTVNVSYPTVAGGVVATGNIPAASVELVLGGVVEGNQSGIGL